MMPTPDFRAGRIRVFYTDVTFLVLDFLEGLYGYLFVCEKIRYELLSYFMSYIMCLLCIYEK